jgi:sporulation protein YlmC with PRC-barrel domain
MKRHWSSIVGLPVFSAEEEKLLGRLRAVFVHPETGQILAFLVGFLNVVAPRDIRHWGKDKMEIASEEDLVKPEEILRIQEFGLRRTLLNGKKILTRSGKRLGRLKDFSIDTTTDSLATLDVSKRFLFWEWAERSFPATDIREITERAIVLNVEEEQVEKVPQKITEPLPF